MCTNFVPSRGTILNERFGVSEPAISFREETYPGYLAPIIRRAANNSHQCDPGVFGLIPSWSRDGKNYRFCYNARRETVAEKPSFRNAWRKGQFCIVPVSAFFEPNYESGKAIRWRIEQADNQPMGLAGIWDAWKRPSADPNGKRVGPADLSLLEGSEFEQDNWVVSFSLLTINADTHNVMNQFHRREDEKRSVVLLAPETFDLWLSGHQGSNDKWDQISSQSARIELKSFASPKPLKSKAPKAPTPVRRLI